MCDFPICNRVDLLLSDQIMKDIKSLFNTFWKYYAFVLSSVSFLGLFYKAYNASFTVDESFSFIAYVSEGFMKIISFGESEANNHLLHSLLSLILYKVFGSSELILRTPALLAFGFYSFSAYGIVKEITTKTLLRYAFLTLMLCNPYLLDFYALSRGYAMQISFMIFGLWQLLRWRKTNSNLSLIAAFVGAALSVLSIFSSLYFFGAFGILFLIILYVKNGEVFHSTAEWFKSLQIPAIVSLALFILIAYPIYQLQNGGKFYFGTTNGFVEDTVGSLVRHSLYGRFDNDYQFLDSVNQVIESFLVGFVICAIAIVVIGFISKGKTWLLSTASLALLFLFLVIGLNLIHTEFLGGLYLIQRVGLFYYPLFIISLFGVFEILSNVKMIRYLVQVLPILIALLLINHVWATFNFDSYFDWKFESASKYVFTEIQKGEIEEGIDPETGKTNLRIYPYFFSTYHYYNKRFDLEKQINIDGVDGAWDDENVLIYIPKDQLNTGAEYEVLNQFPDSYLLFRPSNSN